MVDFKKPYLEARANNIVNALASRNCVQRFRKPAGIDGAHCACLVCSAKSLLYERTHKDYYRPRKTS